MTNIQPTTDEELVILEEWHFETISRQMALELIARIRADAERIMEIDNALETQHKATDDLWNERNELYKKLASVEARAARLMGALQFYADKSNHENDTVDIGVGDISIPLSSRVDSDGGRIARAVLSTLMVQTVEANAVLREKLAATQAMLEPLQAQHDAYFDIESGERIRLVRRAATAEACAARLAKALRTLKIKCEGLICYDDRSCKANDLVDDIEDVLSTSDAQR